MGLLGAEIQLIPDWTVVCQLIIFLAVTAVLSRFVFRPILDVLDKRREATEGDQALAAEYLEKFENRTKSYEERIRTARQEAVQAKEMLRQEGYRSAQKTMAEARHVSLETISDYKAKLNAELDKAKELLEANTSELANDIVERILERSLGEKKRGPYDNDGNPVGDIH